MACSRKQGGTLCFCAQLEQEGGDEGRGHSGEMRIADCLHEQYDGGNGRRRRAKRRELVISLAPTSGPGGTPCDSYSPRTLLSRLLVSLQRPSPLRGGGDDEEGMGCRVRFPMYSLGRRGREKIEEGNVTAAVAEQGSAVKDEGKSPMALDSNAGGGGGLAAVRCRSSKEFTMSSGKKPNGELSLNLGMGVGIVFLLSRSASELNKMTALREQMEALLRDIKNEVQKKDMPHSYAESNYTVSSASESHVNASSSTCNTFQRAVFGNPEGLQKSMENSSCSSPTRGQRCLKRSQMEAELEVELERLQITVNDKSSVIPPNQRRMQSEPVHNNRSKGHEKDFEEECEVTEERSNMQCGVSARELEKRLNQLLKRRQLERIAELEASFNSDADPSDSFNEDVGGLNLSNEEFSIGNFGVPGHGLERKLFMLLEAKQHERIAELESALECARRKLLEKEREICRWRNSARLVSQRRDESLNR